MADEREDWRGERSSDWSARGDWGRPRSEWTREPDQRDWSRQWGYVEGRGPGRDVGSRGWGEGFSSYGSSGRDRDWGRGEPMSRSDFGRGEFGRGDYGRSDWGGQGAGGFGTPWSGGREEWEASRGDRDWGRYAGQSARREGETFRGPHAGRGPKNYQRSDERIREDVCERLCQHGLIDASEVDVRVQNGEVTMQGSVNDRWAKRTAEDVAENVFGVKEVHNQLRVTQPTPGQDQQNREQQNRGTQQRGPWAA
jgi:hypothetical protein